MNSICDGYSIFHNWHTFTDGICLKCGVRDVALAADASCPLSPQLAQSDTGGQKEVKLAQLGAIDPNALMELAKVAGHGATKYERYNFLKGYNYSWSYDALQRHLHAFWGRQDKDPESGLYHLAHAAWHCLCLLAFVLRGVGTDDRP